MKDALSGLRAKSRTIAEFRFKPNAAVADRRGQLINAVFPEVEKTFPYWRLDGGGVTISDDLDRSVNEISVSTRRIFICMEDPGSIQQFQDVVSKVVDHVHGAIGDLILRIDRIGVRLVEVLRHPTLSSFDDIRADLATHVLESTFDLGTPVLDWHVKKAHKSGYLQVGPVKKGEEWLDTAFAKQSPAMPEAGIGLDIDSFARDLTASSSTDMFGAFCSVLDITRSIEARAAIGLKLING